MAIWLIWARNGPSWCRSWLTTSIEKSPALAALTCSLMDATRTRVAVSTEAGKAKRFGVKV